MFTDSIKITEKGQLTLPRKVREVLNSEVVVFEIINNEVIIRPVKSVKGSLQEYSKEMGSFDEIRKKAWDSIADDWEK